MSCCGNKRKVYVAEKAASKPSVGGLAPVITIQRKSRIFEYTGSRGRKIVGSSTGQVYFFRFTGHRVTVSHEDIPGMMSESDVRVLNPAR